MKTRLLFILPLIWLNLQSLNAQDGGWEAGVASVKITPQQSVWMAGYANRDRPAEGTLHELWAKALALEDASGQRAVLVTADLLGIPQALSNRVRDRLQEEMQLSKAQILLNSSHTHCGPVLEDALYDIYPLDDARRLAVARYSAKLEEQLVTLVRQAFADLEPVQIFAENGVSRFQVNRRNNDAATLHLQTDLNGPNDYAVPVIKVLDKTDRVKAIAFGYACHPTVLSFYQWSGDYPGFAQLALEKKYPGATALFFQGAGADQNPLPRRTVALARQYGETLAAAVERVMSEDMKALAPELHTAYQEVDLGLNSHPSTAVLREMASADASYQQRWAARILQESEAGKPFPTTYPYPLQVWRLGDQPIFSMGGEVVVEYAIRLKRIFGPEAFVLGYSNDVMGYIPTATILQEGGYEGASAQMVYGLPGTWTADIEVNIMDGMCKLAERLGIRQVSAPLWPE